MEKQVGFRYRKPVMTPRPEERRKYARLDIALTVSYLVSNPDSEPSERAEAMSGDISAGGLRLMTPTPLKNGDRLELGIYLEGEEENPIQAIGEVVWQNKISDVSFETGVVVSHMETDDKKRFMQFIFDQM